jgi:hypothetical protein
VNPPPAAVSDALGSEFSRAPCTGQPGHVHVALYSTGNIEVPLVPYRTSILHRWLLYLYLPVRLSLHLQRSTVTSHPSPTKLLFLLFTSPSSFSPHITLRHITLSTLQTSRSPSASLSSPPHPLLRYLLRPHFSSSLLVLSAFSSPSHHLPRRRASPPSPTGRQSFCCLTPPSHRHDARKISACAIAPKHTTPSKLASSR